ncbi:MAG: peptide ABC transporter substrate-binding protein [Rhizobiales bacterium]|nr:peptide ABC transporter substrate-binding protein [Hyphomicrobiales bacterium]
MKATLAGFLALTALGCMAAQAAEPKHGGTLKIHHRETPGGISIHEEATFSTNVPMMPVFNNLVLYDQTKEQNSADTIVPELAKSWAWSEDGKTLTFKLQEGVTWHDGKPFTANDVKCTWDKVRGLTQDKFRKNPRKDWYANVTDIRTNGDHEVSFVLSRPQPALLAMLASGYSPVYPCHVTAAQMRAHPIGTGPFKFVELKQNESIKLVKNAGYWKKGLPYLDGIDFQIIPNRSTAVLAFVAGKVDMMFPTEVTVPVLKDVMKQMPSAVCKLVPTNVATNLIINRETEPFNNADVRRALALSLDRKAFSDILMEGKAGIGGTLLPPPEGVWGLPDNILKTIAGYGPDVKKSRDEARSLMQKAGYGPDKRLKLKVSTRNLAVYRDPAVILIDQLKEIYIDGELDVVETGAWFAKVARKDYAIGLNLTGNGIDEPDQSFYENYACGSERNYTQYCNKELQAMFDQQSVERDVEKRRKLVWEIDRRLQEDVARPILYHSRQAGCASPQVKGLTVMVNSSYNGYRYEQLWLDR